jgi:hypothetical protein
MYHPHALISTSKSTHLESSDEAEEGQEASASDVELGSSTSVWHWASRAGGRAGASGRSSADWSNRGGAVAGWVWCDNWSRAVRDRCSWRGVGDWRNRGAALTDWGSRGAASVWNWSDRGAAATRLLAFVPYQVLAYVPCRA